MCHCDSIYLTQADELLNREVVMVPSYGNEEGLPTNPVLNLPRFVLIFSVNVSIVLKECERLYTFAEYLKYPAEHTHIVYTQ